MSPPPAAKSKTKSELIKALPSTLSPSQVVEQLAKQGVKISRNLVYLVRNGRPKAKKAGAKRGPGRPAKRGPGRPRKRGPGRPKKSAPRAARPASSSLSASQRELARMILN